jgi:hypothetical protein
MSSIGAVPRPLQRRQASSSVSDEPQHSPLTACPQHTWNHSFPVPSQSRHSALSLMSVFLMGKRCPPLRIPFASVVVSFRHWEARNGTHLVTMRRPVNGDCLPASDCEVIAVIAYDFCSVFRCRLDRQKLLLGLHIPNSLRYLSIALRIISDMDSPERFCAAFRRFSIDSV